MIKIFGLAFIRNGQKYDYPFQESLTSLAHLCEKTYLALGNSEDETEKLVRDLRLPLSIIPTVWDDSKRQGGLILSEQTNVALMQLRQEHCRDHVWGLYLQGDEVIWEEDYPRFLEDIY